MRNRTTRAGGLAGRAFTLIELLVVIAIIGLPASLILPALGRAKARASGAACLNNLKQLQLCWQMYVDDFQGRVPPNRSLFTDGVWRSTPQFLDRLQQRPARRGLAFNWTAHRCIQSREGLDKA
jgi:prepilin-type N-terminal cleavage/methylation domain-containing protein